MRRYASGGTVYLGLLLLVLFSIFTNSYAWIPHFWQSFWCLLAVVHVLFALGVARDAAEQQSDNKRVYFVEPLVWGLATFIGGFFILIAYWVFHYSTLRRD
jgi:hypothetical protein